MTNTKTINAIAAITMAASFITISAPVANAGPFDVPGIGLTDCVLPGGCGPTLPPGGGVIMPPPPPAPPSGGGGGGSGGGFGKGLGAGIGLGIGLGIVNSLNQPRTVVVQQPTYVQPVQTGLHPHDQYCLNRFKSYNINTKQYLSFSGVFKYCRSPFM